MKRILICGAALVAIAGCSAEKTDGIDIFGSSCEKVAVFEQGDMIVKCPINETLASLQEQTPNGIFVPHDDLNLTEFAADVEHVYLNIIPAGSYEWAQKTEYRIMVKNPNVEKNSLYTISVLIEE